MTLWRDGHGIPHLRGRTVEELAFEQGRVTAQDRGRQLEETRLRGEARFDGGEWDAFAGRCDLAGAAEASYARLGEETRAFVAAYAAGVRTEQPRWRDWTSLAVFHVHQVLFSTYPTKLWRRHVERLLGPEAARLFRLEGLPNGSNAFVVGGARTAGGLPLLAGDPHRVFESPGVYQQVGLAGPGFDVVGLAFPGVPGVQHVGHTGHVAWGVTNAMADYQDVGRDDALLTPVLELRDHGFEALLPLLRARSVADVDAALDHWVEPVNNWLVADRDGRTLHRVAGRMPLRDGSGARVGWLSRDALPRREGGPGDVLVTANDRATPRWSVLGDGFCPPFRRDRITALLDGRDDVDVAAAAAVLTDTRQLDGEALWRRVPALAGWDGHMDADSDEAAYFAAVRDALVERICAAEVLAPLAALSSPCPYGELLAPWFDLRTRVSASLHVLLACERPFGLDLDALVDEAVRAVEADPPAGPWGERHRFAPVPAPGVAAHGAGRPLGGDSDCVAATSSYPGSAASVRGPVARYVLDLADRSRSRWAIPLGAHEDAGSGHHDDQHGAWASGRLLPVEPFALRPVDPAGDADLLHAWVTAPRAEYWGMTERSPEEVEEIYAYIEDQEHLTARLILVEGEPVGILQTYDPEVDEIGEHYERRPGDLGVHLFLADTPARAGRTGALTGYLLDQVLADPAVQRIVLEPDVGNERSVALADRVGARRGEVAALPEKTAQFAFYERPGPTSSGRSPASATVAASTNPGSSSASP